MTHDLITIEIVYATKQKQRLKEMSVVKGTAVEEVIIQSNLSDTFPEIKDNPLKYGIFSRLIPADYVLMEGDRIEIYRPLIADPKLARKKRAKKKVFKNT